MEAEAGWDWGTSETMACYVASQATTGGQPVRLRQASKEGKPAYQENFLKMSYML